MIKSIFECNEKKKVGRKKGLLTCFFYLCFEFEPNIQHLKYWLLHVYSDLKSMKTCFSDMHLHMMHNMGKKALMSYADSEDPDKHASPCSLIWTFSGLRHILQYSLIL